MAFSEKDLLGKWEVFTYAIIPPNATFNSRNVNISYLTIEAERFWYFNEGGTGKYIITYHMRNRSNVILDFTWSLSHDTLNIIQADTVVNYVIDDVKEGNVTRQLYLRLLGKNKTKWFDMSFIPVTSLTYYTELSDFIKDDSIVYTKPDNKIMESIEKYKERYRIDEIVVGYQDDFNKYHYTYPESVKDSDHCMFDDVGNWENRYKFILFVMYNKNMDKIEDIYRMEFYDDKYMGRVVFEYKDKLSINKE